MKVNISLALAAGIGISLMAPGVWAAGVPNAAKSACLIAVNNNYAGMVGDVVVSSSEQWRCLVSNSGKVQDLSVLGK